MDKPRGEGFSLTWWSGEEEDGDDASSAPLSLSPRSSSALLPESTVVTEEQGRDWKPMMRGNFAARKKRKKNSTPRNTDRTDTHCPCPVQAEGRPGVAAAEAHLGRTSS